MLVAQAFTTNVPVQIDPPPVGHVMAVFDGDGPFANRGIISQVHFQEGAGGEAKATCCSRLIRARRRRRWIRRARIWNAIPDSWNIKRPIMRAIKNCSTSKIISQDQLDTDKASLDASTGTVAADKAAITNALLNLEFCHIVRRWTA